MASANMRTGPMIQFQSPDWEARCCQLLDGFATGDLALVVTADTVGHDVEPSDVVAEQRVLVDLASAADVGARHG